VHRDLVSKPVVAKKIAVVGKVDDDRVVIEALSLELPDQRADLADGACYNDTRVEVEAA
jgi:hypothetical protein